jgi:ketosteroid isomerase-like protein
VTNKEIAWSYFELIGEGRIEEAQALLHDAGTLWSSGPRKAIPMRTQKATAADILRAVPMKFTLLDAIAEGDKVVLELESHAKTEDGQDYNNVYAFIMTIFQGKR